MYLLIKQNVKRLREKKNTWIILLIYLLLGIGNYMAIHSGMPFANPNFEFVTSFWEYFVSVQGGGSGIMFVVLPLLVTLSTGEFFIEKRHSSILSYGLIRSSKRTYIRNEIFATGITSFIFVSFAQVILLISALFFTRIGVVDPDQGMIFFAERLLYNAPLIYVLLIIINSSLMAFFFSTFSIWLSIIFKNKYSAMMLPFVAFIGVSMVLMTLPVIFGPYVRIWYEYAPLVMAGDYVSQTPNVLAVPAYWIFGSLLMYVVVTVTFKASFRQEKLLLQ